ncbi:GNAT family N-acetyltransferase [Neobacillus sp. BF23-41]|uniref:GNAT family N-acetyltransferase n=1 Tax=Neobacillus sp. BF23-41 TaxID=3240280 RepID=UPI0034E41BD4
MEIVNSNPTYNILENGNPLRSIKEVSSEFLTQIKQQNFNTVRIGVLQKNLNAIEFWKSLGFKFYANSTWRGKGVDCFEKHLM